MLIDMGAGEKKKLIPNSLRKFRRLMGLSQIDVTKKLKLKSSAIVSRWERGISMPSGKNLLLLESMYMTLVAQMYHEYKQILRKEQIIEKKISKQSKNVKKPKRLDRAP